MKKYLYIAVALLCTSVGFTACSEDDNDGNSSYTVVENAAQAVAGTYSGTWTRTLEEEVKSEAGTITLSAADQPYYVNVTFAENKALGVPAAEVKCNIAQAGDHFIITNTAGAGNALGTSFRLYVRDGKSTQANFVLTVKVGRKAYDYNFTFQGDK